MLLLALFFRHFPKLILNNHIFVAQPPLFRVDVRSSTKNISSKKLYALDDAELAKIEIQLRKQGISDSAWSVSRFKGLGEMSPQQLWETTLNPYTRRFLKVSLPTELDKSYETFSMMLSREQAASRRAWMQEYGNLIEN